LGAGHALGRLGEAGPPPRFSLAEGSRRPWAIRESVVDDVEASMATVPSRTGDGRPVRPTGGGSPRPERSAEAARPPPVGQGHSRPPEAGYPLPRSMRPIKETRRGKATVRTLEAAHRSHDYINNALVIRGEATVSSRRQDPRRWGRPVDQEAGSRRDPPAGGEAGERGH